MAGDVQILCSEYAQRAKMAKYLLTQLPEWTCLVMETLTRRQKLYHYRVHTAAQTPALRDPSLTQTEASSSNPEQNQAASRPGENDAFLDSIEDPETRKLDAEGLSR